jgi:hypothetical protein
MTCLGLLSVFLSSKSCQYCLVEDSIWFLHYGCSFTLRRYLQHCGHRRSSTSGVTPCTSSDLFKTFPLLLNDYDLCSRPSFGLRLYDCSYSPVRSLMYDSYSKNDRFSIPVMFDVQSGLLRHPSSIPFCDNTPSPYCDPLIQ